MQRNWFFPIFSFNINKEVIESSLECITWLDRRLTYDEDCKLSINLRKAHKLACKSLHPFNNKQNVSLALNISDESTIAACKCHCPQRKDMQSFLIMINKWWTIVNYKTRFSTNPLTSAIVKDDGKVEFLPSLADWFSSWSKTRSGLCLSQQTFQAMVLTL